MRSRRARYLTCIAVFAAACTAVAGCSSGGSKGSADAGATSGSSSGSSSGKITIGLSLLSAENPFYNGIAAGIKDAAKSMNVDLQTSFASNSISTQATQIESFVARGVDGILTSPGDPTSLLAAYKQAMDRKLYESVKHVDGSTRRAYAATNEYEYFAELTEAYFGRNDFFPFRRGELKAHDPEGYALMVRAWGEPRR